jgi:hypothetical protein
MSNNIFYNAYIYFTKLKNYQPNQIYLEKTNIIGFYDSSKNIWYNGWAIYDNENTEKYKKSKELLLYAINIERDLHIKNIIEKTMIKSILINSKFYINEEELQLNIIVALIAYFIKAKSYGIFKSESIYIYTMEV